MRSSRGNYTSYSACGIPYLVGGEVGTLDELVARRPQEFRDRFRVDVRMRHEVTAIDLDAREVEVRDIERDRTLRLGFDQALVATGGMPIRPDLPGIDSDHVLGVQTLDDAQDLLGRATREDLRQVVVVGGGYIGLEMAEAFINRGTPVTLIEAGEQVMRSLDPDMAELVVAAMREFGIDVHLGRAATGFEPGHVHTDAGDLDADLVVLGIGVAPNSALAKKSGLDIGVRDAVRVNRRQQTSADGVWAAGNCCESIHRVSGRPVHIALGTARTSSRGSRASTSEAATRRSAASSALRSRGSATPRSRARDSPSGKRLTLASCSGARSSRGALAPATSPAASAPP